MNNKYTRRIFLRDAFVSAAGFAIAAGSSSRSIFGQNTVCNPLPTSENAFQVLSVGDSIMWGQGLLEEQKFNHLICKWLEGEVFGCQKKIEMRVEAHSGATIFPETVGDREFTLRYNSNETNVSNPSVIFQTVNALEYYREKNISTDSVGLILVDGGINDFSPFRFLNLKIEDKQIESAALNFCGYGMKTLLMLLASSFRSAVIAVTGYYQIVSDETPPATLSDAAAQIAGLGRFKKLVNVPGFRERTKLRDELARRSKLWKDASDAQLNATVEAANRDFPLNGNPGEEGYEVKELAGIFRVSEISIYAWFKRWETGGIIGLRDKPGRGRKPILEAEDLAQIKQRVQENAQRLKVAREKLKEELGREFSTKTLKRFLKSLIADTGGGANA